MTADDPARSEPSSPTDPADVDALVESLVERLGGGRAVATAESLTGGLLANRFAKAEGSSDWFRGGVVSYASAVKHDLLGVPEGPVVSEAAARAMAGNVASLLGAELGLAVTGVGGPDPQEGEPPGTVWMAVHDRAGTRARVHHFDGSPEQVCEQTCAAAVALALDHLATEVHA